MCIAHNRTNVIFLSVVGTKLCNANVWRERERERERESVMCSVNCEHKEIRDLIVPSLLPQWWVPLRAFHTSTKTTKTIWKPVEATPMSTQTKMKMSHPLIPTLRLRMHLFWIRYISSLYFSIYLYFLLLVPNLNQYSLKKKILSILIFKTFLPFTMQKWNKN